MEVELFGDLKLALRMVTKSANECACGLVGAQTVQEEKCLIFSKTGICLSSQVLFATKYTLVHSRLTQCQGGISSVFTYVGTSQ